jgi:hypothetical protein
MHELHAATRMVEIAALGERLSGLRLCDAEALSAVRRSLEQYGQLAAVTLFSERDGLQIIDGFKRVRAARAMGWPTLVAQIDDVGAVDAKLRLRELHDRRGLTELEEAWLVRSLYREDRLPQPEIARRMQRHRSWVWRRLMRTRCTSPIWRGRSACPIVKRDVGQEGSMAITRGRMACERHDGRGLRGRARLPGRHVALVVVSARA